MKAPFSDITPPDGLLREPVHSGCFAVAGFNETLYAVELVHDTSLACDRYRVLTYNVQHSAWETLLSQETIEKGEAKPFAEAASIQSLRLGESDAPQEAFYLRLTSPLGRRLLQLTPGGAFEPVGDGVIDDGLFDHSHLTELNGRLFGLNSPKAGVPGKTLGEYQSASRTWQPAASATSSSEAFASPELSDIVAFGSTLYAATIDGERGFELWRSDGAKGPLVWTRILERGGWRYAHNSEALAMIEHAEALYVIAGTSAEKRKPDSQYLDYKGFEIIRINPNGSWELLIGVPRFSPDGLIVPLSGLGAGLSSGLKFEFRSCLSFRQQLLMGLDSINGFQLWASSDGEQWDTLPTPEFSDIYRVDSCRILAIGERLVLVLETSDASGNQSTRIWLGCP